MLEATAKANKKLREVIKSKDTTISEFKLQWNSLKQYIYLPLEYQNQRTGCHQCGGEECQPHKEEGIQ
jgi:hypothetical protein